MSSAKRRGQARGQATDSSGNPRRGANPARGRVAPFDGPASRGSGPGSGAGGQSQVSGTASASREGSRRGSTAGSQPPASAVSAPVAQVVRTGLDPAREGPAPRATDAIKNVDMPASFYNIDGLYGLPTDFAQRPSFNTTGKAIQLPVNSYAVTSFPTAKVYQYDVIIGNGAEKRVVQQKVWKYGKAQAQLSNDFIYDGNKLAWSLKNVGQIKQMVDLDQAEGRPKSKDGKNEFRLHINYTKTLDISVLDSLLSGKVQHNNNVLEAVNFLDHLLREGPSNNPRLFPVKRSFFARGGDKADLGSAIEVFRGVYQTIRPAQGGKMVINLDVANTCFWKPQPLMNAISQKNSWRDANEVPLRLRDEREVTATNKYVKKLSVVANYKGNPRPGVVYKIEKIANVTSDSHKIEWRGTDGQGTGQMISLTAYFQRKYNVQIRFTKLQLVQMTKKMRGEPTYFPMEFLVLVENQRYGSKLDESQTANMIKFAVSPPATRLKAINEGKSWLAWENDKWLKAYGLQISNQQIMTPARVLPAPGVKFKNKTETPQTRGRWDLKAKQFINPNPKELVSWGIGFFDGRVKFDPAALEKFAMDFTKAYRAHGGWIKNQKPHMMPLPNDPGQAVATLFQATGNTFQTRPQILIFLVQNRGAQHYLRIKKSCDCRFGVVSQVMQASQVQKGNPQYYSNVLMKFNAKLGGATAQSTPGQGSGFTGNFTAPTLFIGADVSHASPGSEQASMAAVTVSFDRFAGRYAAGCQTNGRRVEMITDANMRSILGPLVTTWMSDVGGGRAPAQVYYMRDGVSEGQFLKVMEEEVPSILGVLNQVAGGKWQGKLTVIIASKRHHIRAFPKANDGDQKGNPLPGTLIERDVTSPKEFDFYLYSHIALQGTSRPVHYTVLRDDANHTPAQLQNMIYEHCYQYMRSTTAVSLHPAVYYAHLASNRAKAHEDVPASAGPQGGPGFKQNQSSSSSDGPRSSDVPRLIPLHTAANSGIQYGMWYI